MMAGAEILVCSFRSQIFPAVFYANSLKSAASPETRKFSLHDGNNVYDDVACVSDG